MNPFPVSLSTALLLLASASPALAQFGGQPGGIGPGQPQPEDTREEGPAEAAPEEEVEAPSELEPLGGYPGQLRRQTQIIELDGYLRVRTDFLHKLHLGQTYANDRGLRRPPFPLPLECGPAQALGDPSRMAGCSHNSLGGGNLRLRLEPTINVTDQVRVHAQFDVLDNTILGSTPDSLALATRPGELAITNEAPVGALYNTQDPPEIGKTGFSPSLRAKRAWGEVDSEFGSLRFGRMPWHFGRGILFNNGACPECEGGTTIDRIMGLTQVYGHQLALAWDFGAQGYHIDMTDLGRRDIGVPPLDLSQKDDVFELMAAFTLLDDERRFRERVDLGELAVNYGLQLVYRSQSAELYELPASTAGMTVGEQGAPTREDLATGLTRNVGARLFLPSLWFKVGWKAFTIEAEISAVLGKIDNAGPLVDDPNQKKLTVRQFGWVLASEFRLYRNALFLGFEHGGATGDQAEDIRSHLNFRWRTVQQPLGDTQLKDFKFNPDYHVDQILFRRILGTVTNALYFKPSITYWLDLIDARQLGLSGAIIYSMAPVQVSTPGNSLSYGVELNAGLTYRNPPSGFYGGVTWGVLWPMGALDRGLITGGPNVTSFTSKDDAASAQVFRTFLGIRF